MSSRIGLVTYGHTVGKSSLFPTDDKSSIRGNVTLGYNFIFGPVRSGRLGLSLGLDLLGDAICSLDCIYCEVGKTTCLTTERKPYVPAPDVLDELLRWKNEATRMPDFVTLGGKGEPSLNSDMGVIIEGVKKIFPDTPVAVLTNSTLLADPEVRRELCLADVVLPSIDTLVDDEMRRVNRQHKSLNVATLRQGLLDFRKEFDGRIFLEVLLVGGVNDSDENRKLLREFIAEMKPDRVDVVTMTRPGTLHAASPVPADVLDQWRKELAGATDEQTSRQPASQSGGHNISSDARKDGGVKRQHLSDQAVQEFVLSSVSRRPQTASQLADALGLPLEDVQKALQSLTRDKKIHAGDGEGESFYGAF